MTIRVGRRGGFLATYGLAWIAYGIGILVDPAFGVKQGLGWMAAIVPFPLLAWLWIACGAAAIAAVPIRRPGGDAFGFALASAPPTVWTLAYLLGIGIYPRGAFSAVVWIALSGSVAIVAGMSEPPAPRHG